jgi:hypothetical protein
MAPEQLEGQDADTRTDIFALGAIVYEMVTGTKAFEGKSQASVISAIMSSPPPPISAHQPLAPTALDHLVRTCLAKDRDERRQTAHDALLDLKWIAEERSRVAIPAHLFSRRRWRERLTWIAATLGVMSVAFAIIQSNRAAPVGSTVRFEVPPPTTAGFALHSTPAVSPDGHRLAFVAPTPEGKNLVWVRSFEATSAQALLGTDGASFPFWSPDNGSVAFFAQGQLKRINVSGGSPQALADAPVGFGGTWNRDGVIVFAPNTYGTLYRVSAVGGPASPATTLDGTQREYFHRWPQFLPDGQHFLYFAFSPQREAQGIYVASLGSSATQLVLRSGAAASFAASGQLLFMRGGTLMAQPFSQARLQLSGDAVSVAEQVGYIIGTNRWTFSTSDTGVLTFRVSDFLNSDLVWFDRRGKRLGRSFIIAPL